MDSTFTTSAPQQQQPALPFGGAPISPPVQVPAPAPAPITPDNLQTMFTQAAAQQQPPTQVAPEAATVGFPAAPAPLPVATPPAQSPSQYAAQAAELGIELPATATDAEVAAAVMARYQQIAPVAQFGQSMLPYADQMNEFFRAQGTAPPSVAQQPGTGPAEWTPQAHFQKLWNVPQITPEMKFAIDQGMVLRDDESGLMKPRPGMEMMVAPILHGLNQALNYQRQQWQEIMQANPYEKFYGAMQEPIEKLIDQRVQEKLNGYQSQVQNVSTVNQFEQQNQQWLYQQNANGGRMLTPVGQYFTQLYQAKQGSWSGTNEDLLRDCRDLTELAVMRSRATQPAPAPVAPPPNGNGQYPNPAQVSQQRQQSFLQTALTQAAHAPNGGANPVQSASGPIVVTPGELESMFVNDFRAGRSAA